jgi:hypothetical protein
MKGRFLPGYNFLNNKVTEVISQELSPYILNLFFSAVSSSVFFLVASKLLSFSRSVFALSSSPPSYPRIVLLSTSSFSYSLSSFSFLFLFFLLLLLILSHFIVLPFLLIILLFFLVLFLNLLLSFYPFPVVLPGHAVA